MIFCHSKRSEKSICKFVALNPSPAVQDGKEGIF